MCHESFHSIFTNETPCMFFWVALYFQRGACTLSEELENKYGTLLPVSKSPRALEISWPAGSMRKDSTLILYNFIVSPWQFNFLLHADFSKSLLLSVAWRSRSDVSHSLSHWTLVDLTDVTLVNDDTFRRLYWWRWWWRSRWRWRWRWRWLRWLRWLRW